MFWCMAVSGRMKCNKIGAHIRQGLEYSVEMACCNWNIVRGSGRHGRKNMIKLENIHKNVPGMEALVL